MPIVINHSPVAAVANLATKAGKEDQARYQDQQRLQQQQMQAQQQAGQEASRFRNLQEMRMTRQLEHQMESQQAQQELREREFTFRQKIETARAKGNETRAKELEAQASQAAQQEMQAAEARRAERGAVISTILEKAPDMPREALGLMTDAALASFATRIASMDPANPDDAAQANEIARGLAEGQRKTEVDRLQAEITEHRRVLGGLSEGKYGDVMEKSEAEVRSMFGGDASADPIILRRRAAITAMKNLSNLQRDESLRNTTGQIMDVTAFDATVGGRTFDRIMETVLEKASEKGEQVTGAKIQRRLRELGWADLEQESLDEIVEAAQEQQEMEPEREQQEGESSEGKKPASDQDKYRDKWTWGATPRTPRQLDPYRVSGVEPPMIENPSSVRGGATPEGAMIVAPAEQADSPKATPMQEANRLIEEGDIDGAEQMFQKMWDDETPHAAEGLAYVAFTRGQTEEGVEWIRKGMRAGSVYSVVAMGHAYRTGDRGVPKDVEKARALYLKALESDQIVARERAQRGLDKLDAEKGTE